MQAFLLAVVTFLIGSAPPGVIAPRVGADLGAHGTVVVEGYGASVPTSGTISVDMILHRLLKGEWRGPGPGVVRFDWQRPFNKSFIVLSIPGTAYEQRFEVPWTPTAFPLGPFDGAVDFAGPSGMTITRDKIVRVIELIPPEFLPLFAGDSVTLEWYYDSETSKQGGAFTCEVDEHMDPGRAATHFSGP